MVMIKARLFAVAVLLSFAFTFSGLAVAQEDSPTPVNMAPAPPDVQQTAPPEALPPGIVRPQGMLSPPRAVSRLPVKELTLTSRFSFPPASKYFPPSPMSPSPKPRPPWAAFTT